MMKDKVNYSYSLILSLGIVLVLSLYVFDKIFSSVPLSNPSKNEEKVDQKVIEDELIEIVKGYSAAVDKVVFSEKDDNSKFIHYQNLAEAKAEFIPYMDEDVIEEFLKRYNIYEKNDGLYVHGSGYIPMTFEDGDPYEINKENDNQYKLTQEQHTDFYGERLLTVIFHKSGDKWFMLPPED